MVKFVGYPKCVCGEPFTLVHSPAEERAWTKANVKVKLKPGPKPKVEQTEEG